MPRIPFEDVYEAFISHAFVKQKTAALPEFVWSRAPGQFFSFLRIPPPSAQLSITCITSPHFVSIGLMTNQLLLGLAYQP